MNAKEAVVKVFSDRSITKSGAARQMNVRPQTVNGMLHDPRSYTMKVSALCALMKVAGYEVAVMPIGKAARIDGAYVIDDEFHTVTDVRKDADAK